MAAGGGRAPVRSCQQTSQNLFEMSCGMLHDFIRRLTIYTAFCGSLRPDAEMLLAASGGSVGRKGIMRPTEFKQPTPNLIGGDYSSPPIVRAGFLRSKRGVGLSGFWRFGSRSVEPPPGLRLILGNSTIDLSKSTITGWRSESAQPLSIPAYLPGDVVNPRVATAALKIMSYFSNGSIVRLYSAPMPPELRVGPSQVSFDVKTNFQAMLRSGLLGSSPMSALTAPKDSPLT